MARTRETQRGGSKLNLLITIIIVGSMGFAGYKVIPTYFANFQLQDSMQTEAKFALANRESATDIQSDILKKAQELGVPATQDDVIVTSQQGAVSIEVDYSVTFDLIVYQWNKSFHLYADNHSI
jgi:Domain of unknown function (DUF4845)